MVKYCSTGTLTYTTSKSIKLSKMGYDLVRGEDKDLKRLNQFQNGLLITNILLMIIALANFSVCIWVRYSNHLHLGIQISCTHFRFDLDFWEWVLEIGWYRYWNVMYIVMVAMVFHAANNALSAYGTFTQNRILLLVSIIIRYLNM